MAAVSPGPSIAALWQIATSQLSQAGPLDDLAKPMEGRSMRATSTMREGEVRRMGAEKRFPKAPPRAGHQ